METADIYETVVERHRCAATVITSNHEPPAAAIADVPMVRILPLIIGGSGLTLTSSLRLR